jgi:hypothetical protein
MAACIPAATEPATIPAPPKPKDIGINATQAITPPATAAPIPIFFQILELLI